MSAKGKRRRKRPGAGPVRRGEAGYTLLLALFFAAVMIIAASVAIPNLITQDRRQKEKLMIWRGDQYARAIGLYYRKTGHFPHDLKELEKGVAGIHFLRQPYVDPMNPNGSWRLIYLGAGGQFIGSLCWQTMAQYQAAEMGVPLTGTGANVSTNASTGSAANPPANAAPPLSLFGQQAGTENGTSGNKEAVVPTCEMLGANPSSSIHPQVITEGQMVGGNLIGVASQANAPSIKNYMGADNYRYWEFIWNPQQGQQATLPATNNPATGNGASGPSKTSAQPGMPAPTSPAPSSPLGDEPPQP